WFVRQTAELENQIIMTSVERIKEYTEIKPESANTEVTTPKDWPSNGRINFEHMSFRHHKKLPYVFHDISCSIKPREKVDSNSISNVGLSFLRGKISVIPQDPSLFVGTLRSNLDPFNAYDDSQLWRALDELRSLDSMTYRSVLRAILKKNKILIIDEATANVDFSTDQIIQKSIRNKFRHCTVIRIAHRLNTIIDCDRIMLFKDGRLVEFDSAFNLLQNQNSQFF
ncbi:uncharacterized protein TRIADDRAFT_22300, partial [Trichoplax adhaerens]